MSNTITNVVPKLLAQGVLALRQAVMMPQLVNGGYSTLASQRGNVINVPIPSAIASRNVTPGFTMVSNVDFTPTVALVTLDFWKETLFQMSDNDMVSVQDGTLPMQASEAIKTLANDCDVLVMGKAVGVYGFTGTPGTTPFASNITAAITARKKLNRQLAPMDNRRMVLDPEAEANALGLANILDFDKRGDQGGIIRGSIGTKLGMDWYMDQNIDTYTPGTGWVTGWVLSTVGAAAGDVTLNILNATAAGTIKVGDIFTVNGGSQTYVVTVAATASATVARLISFNPALASLAATGAAITVVGTAYTRNLTFHRDAFAWASRPLGDIPELGSVFRSVADPVSQIALRLEVSRQNKQTAFSYDILAGTNLIRPELACIVAG